MLTQYRIFVGSARLRTQRRAVSLRSELKTNFWRWKTEFKIFNFVVSFFIIIIYSLENGKIHWIILLNSDIEIGREEPRRTPPRIPTDLPSAKGSVHDSLTSAEACASRSSVESHGGYATWDLLHSELKILLFLWLASRLQSKKGWTLYRMGDLSIDDWKLRQISFIPNPNLHMPTLVASFELMSDASHQFGILSCSWTRMKFSLSTTLTQMLRTVFTYCPFLETSTRRSISTSRFGMSVVCFDLSVRPWTHFAVFVSAVSKSLISTSCLEWSPL